MCYGKPREVHRAKARFSQGNPGGGDAAGCAVGPRLKITDIRVVALKTIRETGTMEAA